MTDDDDILSHLNPDQQQAVAFKTGPLLILAGAGSGKTRVLTYRAAWLIKKQLVLPQNILLLTFTNKAAEEMKARLRQLLVKSSQSSVNLPWAGTFHAFCARVLRYDGRYLDIPINYLIYDEADQKETLKLAINKLDLPPKRFPVPAVANLISQAKNELITPLEYLNYVQGDWQKDVAQIYLKYQQLLKEFGALDFDDLLLSTVRLFQKEKAVAKKYQDQYPWILIDEYQDTNHAQYTLTRLLAGSRRNLTVVGDASQCLPPGTLISTPNGPIPIQKVTPNMEVFAASGRGKMGKFPVASISSREYRGTLVEITTEGKKQMRVTPNHFLFARLVPTDNLYFVYLMYRRDKGYRIGMAKGKRAGDFRRGYLPTVGLCTRGNQEAADKMWVLKACRKKEEADFWEYWFSSQYGIPTLVFDIGGRKMKLSQSQIDKLFLTINTVKRAQQLMKDFQIDPEFPHHRPRGTSGNKHPDRQIIHLKFFEDRRQSTRSPWSAHRIALNTTDINLEKKVKGAGFFTRAGRRNTWRTEILRLQYDEAEKIAKALSRAGGGLEISREAFLGENQKFFFQPASHIQPGMIVPVQKNNKVQAEKVVSVKRKTYKGMVYDLNIPRVHNYLANNIVVHNSIYSWRGADFRNLANLKKDFTDLKIINLEQNYRSTQIILDAANEVIKKNTAHPILKLWTDKTGGEKITLYQAASETDEASTVLDIIYRQQSRRQWSDFAVLYRTNAQSRILEEAFLKMGIPYQLVGGVHFYERREVKDCLAYLRLAANHKDLVSLKRAEKLGKGRLKKFQELLTKKETLIKTMPTLAILEDILKATDYLAIFDANDPQDQSRIENVKELSSVAIEFPDLLQFLENVALMEQRSSPTGGEPASPNASQGGCVTLMTCHAAKGTEFSQVIVVGMEEGLFPHSRSLMEKDLLEEERRLCYVAMTRAKEKLYLIFARQRFFLGERSSNLPSRFIAEIPAALVDFRNGPPAGEAW